jgi:hypothetical protein
LGPRVGLDDVDETKISNLTGNRIRLLDYPARCIVSIPPELPWLLGRNSLNEVEVNLRPTVSRPACLGVRRPSGTLDQFFFLLEIPFRRLRDCYFVAPSLTRGRVCNLL